MDWFTPPIGREKRRKVDSRTALSETVPGRRHQHLDSVRGLAAAIVVSVHFLAAFLPYAVGLNRGPYPAHSSFDVLFWFPPLHVLAASHFAVSLFFLLSGYVLSLPYLGQGNTRSRILGAAAKRPVRLGGLTALSALACAGLWYAGAFHNVAAAEITGSQQWFGLFWGNDFSFPRAMRDLSTSLFTLGKRYNPPLWTMRYELYGSLLIFAYLFCFGSFRYRLLAAAVLAWLFRGSNYQAFFLGAVLADPQTRRVFAMPPAPRRAFLWILLLAGMFFLYVPAMYKVGNTSFPRDAFRPLLLLFGGDHALSAAFFLFTFLLVNDSLQEKLASRWLVSLGNISFAVYMLHFPVLGSFTAWLFLRLSPHMAYGLCALLAILASMALILPLSWAATKFVDAPCIRLASRIGSLVSGLVRLKTRGGEIGSEREHGVA